MNPKLPVAVLLIATLAACAGESAPTYDLAINNGHVIDPESGLDDVRHLGISDGRIVVVSEEPVSGTRTIDATGHVVSPGFIDLHEHGQFEEAYAMMVRDGVTTAFELEVGAPDVDAWYAELRKTRFLTGATLVIQLDRALCYDEDDKTWKYYEKFTT